jgi:hypothetical protein
VQGKLEAALARVAAYDEQHASLIDDLARKLDDSVSPEGDVWDCCRHADECWRGTAKPPAPYRLRVPFVGPTYEGTRTVVLSMNSRDSGQPNDDFSGMADVLQSLCDGRRTYGGSHYHYRAATAVALVARARAGLDLEIAPKPDTLVDYLMGSARVQSVQCAPEGGRRSPRSLMWKNCPGFIAAEQLRTLRPRTVVMFSTPNLRALRVSLGLDHRWSSSWADNDRCFARGFLDFDGESAELFAMNHPSTSRWPRSIEALVRSLESEPPS